LLLHSDGGDIAADPTTAHPVPLLHEGGVLKSSEKCFVRGFILGCAASAAIRLRGALAPFLPDAGMPVLTRVHDLPGCFRLRARFPATGLASLADHAPD